MKLEKSWHKALEEEIKKPYIKELKDFLIKERAQSIPIYPKEENVFSAFRYAPFEKVNVVIVGQDPYHGPNQAHGLSFSVPLGIKPPPSLINIYKELHSDLGIVPPNHGNLVKWAKQGVLLLNATLTVRQGTPQSHYGRGWERFTDAVVYQLMKRENPVIFVLWGKNAKEKCERVLNEHSHPHLVLTSAHPSPFSATRFFGCRHFSKINDQLKSWNKAPIDWALTPSI